MAEYGEAGSEAGYQRDQQKRAREALRNYQIEQQKKELVRQFLETAAYERLMNIRVSNPELYNQMVSYIVSLAQSGNLRGKISEAQFTALLGKLTFRKEPSIEFRHK